VSRLIDLTGQTFTLLRVVSRAPNSPTKKIRWRCVCKCGKAATVLGTSLRRGETRSCGCIQAVSRQHLALNAVYHQYKASAKRRGLSFELSKPTLEAFIAGTCVYCGRKPRERSIDKSKGLRLAYNGLDRVVNEYGYTTGNVVPCCPQCNYAKNNRTLEEFKEWICAAYRHLEPSGRLDEAHASLLTKELEGRCEYV